MRNRTSTLLEPQVSSITTIKILEPDGAATRLLKEYTCKVLTTLGQRHTVPHLTGWCSVFREWVVTKAMQGPQVSSVDRAPAPGHPTRKESELFIVASMWKKLKRPVNACIQEV